MKKIASLMGAGAMLFGMAAPSFAYSWFTPVSKVSVGNNVTVNTEIKAKVNTGMNKVVSGFTGGTIGTGVAITLGQVSNTVNTNTVGVKVADVNVSNFANVNTGVKANVNTGMNSVIGGMFTSGLIGTGDAQATGGVTNVVNTNVVSD